MPLPVYRNRQEAGMKLAEVLVALKLEKPVVFALPRGGVPVAGPVAERLRAPLDLILVRKIGVPGSEELAAGSVVDGEQTDIVLNPDIVKMAGMSEAQIQAAAAGHVREIQRRRALYLPGREPMSAHGRTAILIDDGIATGASMRAAVVAIRRRAPAAIVVAVPVAAADTVRALESEVDRVVCPVAPAHFGAVGYFYEDFHQVSDAEVIEALTAFTQRKG